MIIQKKKTIAVANKFVVLRTTAADTLRSVLTSFRAVLGTRGAIKGIRSRAASANRLRLRSADFV